MRSAPTVHYLSVVGPPLVCALVGGLIGLAFDGPAWGTIYGLIGGAGVAAWPLILAAFGGITAESASPDLTPHDSQPRNHVICIDGTWNHPKEPTNVREFFDAVDVKAEPGDIEQIARYYPGVGARENKGVALRVHQQEYSLLLLGGATGLGADAILKQAYFDFVKEYRLGDRVFIVGFSRGAAIARMLATLIASEYGLPQRVEIQYQHSPIAQPSVADFIIDTPLKWGAPEVEFLGVWDTVASFGIPWNRKDLFKNFTLAPGVRRAYHLVAIDERRKTFDVTPFEEDERVEEIWFAGAHANVGGGLGQDNRGLSNIALRFMINRARKHGLRFTTSALEIRGDVRGATWHEGTFWKWKIERGLGNGTGPLPRVHTSVFQRMQSVADYRPVNVTKLGEAYERDDRD